VTLAATGLENTTNYLVEIVTDRGDFLSVPNEAIIEEGDRHIVYVQLPSGQYEPKEIKIGIQGELYTQVLDGVPADVQVVTFGSFFIDSEYKLKGPAQGGQ
jgi:Cu(I)/Ag(I) efflux system membrane fusion protein